MTCTAWGSVVVGDFAEADAVSLVRRSRRRAHLGGRSSEGKTQAILARRQLEHGDTLSQRTLRRRQTAQLRNFGVGAERDAAAGAGAAAGAAVDDVAFFSEGDAEPLGPASGSPRGDWKLMAKFDCCRVYWVFQF